MIGQMISHYKVTEKIGEGGMGVVYKALDTHLDRHVALKFFPESATPSQKDKQRFIREAKSAAALNHPNVCTIHNVDEFENRQFIVMEYVAGETLREKMNAGTLPTETALSYAIQIAEALSAAHRQHIIHRDIKPENIMIDSEGRVKVMDFGLAKFKDTGDITKTGDTVGTTAYMSPEQAKGRNIDHRTDIWSLGIVLYEMFSGRKPFFSEYPQAVIYSIVNEEPEAITEINPGLSPALSDIIHKALEKDVDKRYQSVDELHEELKKVVGPVGLGTGHAGISKKVTTLKDRLLTPLPLASLGIIVIVLLGLFLFLPQQNIDFEERDWIMITDFENHTGEQEFSQFLNTILEVGLTQSAYVNVYERQHVLNILNNELEISGVKTLTPDVIRKAANKEDVGVIVVPAISKEGDSYALSAEIRDITSNTVRQLEPVRADNKDAILKAMDQFSKKLRQSLGESQSSISDSYTPIVQATTNSLEALKLYAEGMKMKVYDVATGYDLIEQAVALDPDFALAHAELGMHYYINNYRKLGEEHFQKALAEMDRLTLRERLWIRSVVADWRGHREKAIENYKSYLSQYPDDYNAWWRLGYTYLITNQPDNCVEAFSRVVEIEPNDSDAFINIATCYKSLGQNNEALDYYNRAFSINPNEKKGIYVNSEYGFLLVKMGELEQARETFEIMLESKDTKARGLRSLALLNTYTGNFSKAIDYFKEAILLNKSSNILISEYRDRMFLARAYRAKGMKAEFLNEVREIDNIISKMDLSPAWLAKAGLLYARNNMLDKAEEILAKIENNIGDIVASSGVNRNISQDQAFYHLMKGEIALANARYAEAIESLKLAHNIIEFPESMAYGNYKAGNLDTAAEYYREVVRKKEINREEQLKWVMAHYRLGLIHQEQGNNDEAKKYYEQFIEIWEQGDDDLVALSDARKRMKML